MDYRIRPYCDYINHSTFLWILAFILLTEGYAEYIVIMACLFAVCGLEYTLAFSGGPPKRVEHYTFRS
jgi:hypothetical protein